MSVCTLGELLHDTPNMNPYIGPKTWFRRCLFGAAREEHKIVQTKLHLVLDNDYGDHTGTRAYVSTTYSPGSILTMLNKNQTMLNKSEIFFTPPTFHLFDLLDQGVFRLDVELLDADPVK